jgi:hypothetical protein
LTTYILNTTIVPNEGTFALQRISDISDAQMCAEDAVSAVGHESTAQVISTILGFEVPVNRISIYMEPGDRAVCFKLRQRPPEGQVLSAAQLEELGYDFMLLTRLQPTEAAWI